MSCSWRPPDVPAQTASGRRLTLLSTPAPSTDPTRHPLLLVFVDTNVWYPVVLADLVLRSVEIGLFDLAWTDESLTEVERVLVERKGLSAANAAVFGAQVRATAPEGRIGPAADVGRTRRVVLIESFFVPTRIPQP